VSSQRELLAWAMASLAALALLVGGVAQWQKDARTRWAVFLAGNPHSGRHLFQEKGCARCHAVNGVGGGLAPDLGFQRPARGSIDQLVAAMWNHAPRMWEQMRAQNVSYPVISQEEMAHLFAYLYTARYVDEPGDAVHGRRLFESKACSHCHGLYGVGGGIGPDLASVKGGDTPIVWTQAMWNHAPAMETGMQQVGLSWPKFEEREMNNLLAYIRETLGRPKREFELLPADPDRGRKLFQTKSCAVCHGANAEGSRSAPKLGPRPDAPLTIVQFAGLMWNHSPEMWRAMQARNIARPTFEDQEMADLISYLQSLRYFEPGGSAQVGETLFGQRGCADCHGRQGEGTRAGPPLRERGRTYASISLARALWQHGPRMYERAQQLGRPWPTLAESDIGDLVVFLNTAVAKNQ